MSVHGPAVGPHHAARRLLAARARRAPTSSEQVMDNALRGLLADPAKA